MRILASSALLDGPMWRRTLAVVAALALVSGCGSDGAPLDPDPGNGGGGGPGDVQRATLTLTVRIDDADAAVAAALGFPAGAIPGAEVTIRRAGSTAEEKAVADAQGKVTFERLLPGAYQLSAVRLLSAAERAQLPAELADVNAMGGGRGLDVAAPGTDAAVALTAGRPGSLVISEVWWGTGVHATEGIYYYGFYLELYNNGDSTVYLDGKLLLRPHVYGYNYNGDACSRFEPVTNDPDGIWTMFMWQFPGAGSTYPVRPGEAAVVAAQAIDHSAIFPNQFDLSRTAFEFARPPGADNPFVPNLVDVGPRPYSGSTGLIWNTTGIMAVADPVAIAALPQAFSPGTDEIVVRVPASSILDAVSYWADYTSPTPRCPRQVHEGFDRQGATGPTGSAFASMKRRALLTLPDGRVVLQRTYTGARDFTTGPATPGTVP